MLNVQSVLTRSNVINKPSALNELVVQQNYDIFVIIEIWLRCKGDDATKLYSYSYTPPREQ